MSEQSHTEKNDDAEGKLSIQRVLMGQLISWIVIFAVLYPILQNVGNDAQVVYGSQKVFLLSSGAFVLQFAHMVGFRTRGNYFTAVADYLYLFTTVVNMVASSYVFGVARHGVPVGIYLTGLAVVLCATVIPVVVYDVIRSKKKSTLPAAE